MPIPVLAPESLVFLKHKAKPLKRILGVLKESLTDVNILFNRTDIRIEGIDPEKLTVTQLWLQNFEEYTCVEDGVRIGLYMAYLYKILRAVGPTDIIEMAVERSTPNVLAVTVTNIDKNTRSFTAIKSMDLPLEKVDVPDVDFDSMVTVPMSDLQRALREVSLLSKRVCFGHSGDNIQLIASGPIGVANLVIGPTANGLVWHKQAGESSHGLYFTKFIEKFIKPDVSDSVDIYFKKGFPLVFQYSDRDYLGVLRFAVAEIQEPST